MDEKPKRRPKEQPEPSGEVTFVASQNLAECIRTIVDLKKPYKDILHSGLEAAVENREPGLYYYQVSILYSPRRNRRPLLFVDGELSERDAESTAVTARLHIRWMDFILGGLLSLVILGVLFPFMPPLIPWVTLAILALFWVWFALRLVLDRSYLMLRLQQALMR
jgi:hypothetical protein